MRRLLPLTALLLAACAGTPVAPTEARVAFFEGLGDLCGARFEGAMTYPAEGPHDFAGKALVATVGPCGADEIRVPFTVGTDRSRTWVFRRVDGGLQLKHDHRHEDGTPDAVTMYGGMAGDSGTATRQSFAADAFTAALIPDAATNVWTVSVSDDRQTLTYHLERHGKPRFTAVLSRQPR